MTARFTVGFLLTFAIAQAVIVDRIAIIAGKKIIKDSDIVNDLRVTAFLNQQPLSFTSAARKQSANRLLDQCFIRAEVDSGDYPIATVEEAQNTLNGLIKSRYRTDAAYKTALASYGISESELKERLLWQLTVLRFIDARFKSSASYVTDEEIRQYYEAHKQQFGSDLNAARPKIEETLAGERTNKAFYDWLDRKRKAATIRYLEDSLK
jgi:hypothetical protein